MQIRPENLSSRATNIIHNITFKFTASASAPIIIYSKDNDRKIKTSKLKSILN